MSQALHLSDNKHVMNPQRKEIGVVLSFFIIAGNANNI